MADDWHILIVEDDPRLRERLARYLGSEGFRVTAATDAADSIQPMVVVVRSVRKGRLKQYSGGDMRA